ARFDLLVFFLPFQLSQYYAVDPFPGIWHFANTGPQLLAAGWVILFLLYYAGYRLCPSRPSRSAMALLVAFPVLFSLILLFIYPFGANDIYDNIFRGHTFGHLGVNPYTAVPNNFPGDPLLKYAWWKDVPGTYGPLWQLL